MELLDNLNEIGNKLRNINFSEIQNNFLDSTLGKITNFAIDEGLKSVLPDFLEDEIIEVKDELINNGLKEGIDTAIENAIKLGKATLGIFTGNFESVEQAHSAVKEGGLIDGLSKALDFTVNKLEDNNIISSNISDLILTGKNLILKNVNNNIEKEFLIETASVNKLEKYIDNWEKSYQNKDIEGMEKEYKKIKKEVDKILPLEKILNNIKKIENINGLIKNNENFNFDNTYLDLANKF